MNFVNKHLLNKISNKWKGSSLQKESTLHQVSPYIGKIKSSMARTLVSTFSKEGDTVYEPFSGSGSVALESWIACRNIVANDLNPYAAMITRAKLFPYNSVNKTLSEVEKVAKEVKLIIPKIDLRTIPKGIRAFFHLQTLKETIAWCRVLKLNHSYFLLSCLLGILHHQRPGFLSYPCSHTVPYLRLKKFPYKEYPEMYQYRPLQERLEKKVLRVFKRIPELDYRIIRKCYMLDSGRFIPEQKVDVIITSPPYMRQLSYARDNRLRLWFIGINDWKQLDSKISPTSKKYFDLCRSCLKLWHTILPPKGLCVLVLGDNYSHQYKMHLPDAIAHIATKEIGGYSVAWKYTEAIPNDRRIRRGCYGNLTETILVLRKNNRS
jgi:DNA modification methylase